MNSVQFVFPSHQERSTHQIISLFLEIYKQFNGNHLVSTFTVVSVELTQKFETTESKNLFLSSSRNKTNMCYAIAMSI